ncbi:unnamed protein product [Cuscuta campestris]|uniref:Reverse transcriptase domain-containing protein n=1 Tax=Cuscuta campestris TaxID=132261 RepID=A0A484KWQ1_9ASTE|nr:unnamed protein product [Cuscuta campestris]
MMKLDIQKAYDSVSWEAISSILYNLRFPEQFISWVMFCVSTPSYTLNVNGSHYAYFKGARGLRQGDPMSPLLFVLVMEYLTRSFQAAVNKGRFGFHPLCASMKIVNLCFADDLIVVCKAETKAVNCIMKVLKEFKLATGLSINYNKSHIVFGGINEQMKEELLKITKMKMGTLPFTYLGSPITAARLSASDCDALVHKITTKIGAWGSRHFSYAARIRIINSVLMGIITFWSRIFIIPKGVLKKVTSICRNFLWGSSSDYKRTPLVKWEEVCQRRNYGGLGLKNIFNWNRAIVMKLNWDIANKKDVLWVKWIHNRYIRGADFWNYLPSKDSCQYWKAMIKV